MFWAEDDVEFIEATYEPGGASSTDGQLVRHSGQEFGCVLSGTLHVVVGFEEYVLEAGDSITFPSSTPHLLKNESDEPARAIWVYAIVAVSPPLRSTPRLLGTCGAPTDERTGAGSWRYGHQWRKCRQTTTGRWLGGPRPLPESRRCRSAH